MEAKEGEERPQDGPQKGIEGPAEELLEWPHHEDMEYTDEPLDSSLLVDEVAEELQHLQLPWEQPQQGLADIFEDGVYFNDGYAEDCYLTNVDPIKATRKAVSSTLAKE